MTTNTTAPTPHPTALAGGSLGRVPARELTPGTRIMFGAYRVEVLDVSDPAEALLLGGGTRATRATQAMPAPVSGSRRAEVRLDLRDLDNGTREQVTVTAAQPYLVLGTTS